MSEKQHEDRLIHVACDVPPQVFGPLLLLLHDCRVENLQTIIPERGTARVHHKQALALPKPAKRDGKPWHKAIAQRQDVRQRLLEALNEHPDGITAADMRARHFPDYKSTLTVAVPLDRLYQKGVLDRSPDRPHRYWLKQRAATALAKPAKSSAGGRLSERVVSVIRQHPAGLSSAQVRELVGASDRAHQVFTCLGGLFKRGKIHRVGDRTKGFTYLPRTAS